jgi:3-hydroxyacyl-[acyl-carrier-protein] dehydratase
MEINRMQDHINISEILKIIPHRYPFLLVDKIIDIDKGKSATGIKNITFNEPQFMGHFPGSPVMPGVLIIESMAQVACILAIKSMDIESLENRLVYFMSIDSVKFRKIVSPGDVLHLKVTIEQKRGDVWKFAAEALVENTKVAEALFTAVVK